MKTNFLDYQNFPPDHFDEPITSSWQEALKLRREMLLTPLSSEADLLDVIPFKGVPEIKQVQMEGTTGSSSLLNTKTLVHAPDLQMMF